VSETTEISRRRLIAAGAIAIAAAPVAAALTTDDEAAIRTLEEGVATVLTREGWDAYSALFHQDYVNWADGSRLTTREEFLSAVKRWHEAGNQATATSLVPVSLEIFGDVAYFRYRLREDFNNGATFIGDFASMPRRQNGAWLLYRTSFWTKYRGPTNDAPDFPGGEG